MSIENENLFEGIQIMTPSELNSSLQGGEPSKEETEEKTNLEEGFEIKPVVTETGESGTTEKKEIFASSETKIENSSNEKNEALYKALIKTLVDENVITLDEQIKLEEMPGNVESIKKLMANTIEKGYNEKQESWKNSLSSEKKKFLEIEDAFDKTDHAIVMAQRLQFFDTLTEDKLAENQELQKQLYFEQLTALKNFSKEDAIEAVEEAVKSEKIAEKANKAFPELKEQANKIVEEGKLENQKRTQEEIEAQTKAFESLMTAIDSKEYFIDGLNLNKTSKEKLKNNIVNPVYKDPKTGKEYNSLMYKQMKNAAEFEMILNYYDTLGLFNIDSSGKFKPDISKIKAVAKTAAITELDKVIASEEQRGVGRNTSVEMSEKSKNTLSLLEKAFGGQ